MKLIKLFAVAMLLVLSANAQNPPLPDPARGITIINGHIGLNTNSATAGQSIVFNGSAVVWGAGAGTSFDTNANWIVNGTWKFTNTVKFPGHIYDDTDKESISSQQRILFDTNEIEAVEWWARLLERANASIALDWANSVMNDSQNVLSENFNSRFLAGSDGNSVYNWQSGDTFDGAQNRIMNLKQGNIWDASNVPVLDSPNRRLIAADGGYFASFGTYTLNDNNSNPSLNSNTRTLRDSSNLNVLDWENKAIGTQGGAWTINGVSSSNFLTNLVASSAPFITISGTGGHTYTITGVGTVITNNASPTFAALTATTYNSLLPDTFVTNITSAGMTVTQQGTHTINIEPIVSSVNVTNITGDGVGITVTGTGTKSYNIAGNYTVLVTNNSSATLTGLTVNGNTTLGQNSGNTLSIVGNTVNIANGVNFGAGQWNIPSVGVITNTGAGIFALNTITASNVVTTTSVAGTTTIDSGTNNTFQIKANNGAGTLQTFAMYTVSTNTPAGINPTVNTINTNGSQVAFIEVACTFGANSRAFLWTSTAMGPKSRFATSVACTNSILGFIQPNATWAVSNDLGTVTAIAGEGHVETH